MREAVAKALYGKIGPPKIAWDEVSESSRQTFLTMADIAIEALGLEQVWSDDVAGPDWQRYSYWRTPTVKHPGPARIASGLH